MAIDAKVAVLCIIIQMLLADVSSKEDAKVLILGAGMTGVSAAKRLKELGEEDFIIIEGSDRVGGRARQQSLGGYMVQLGPLWVHGAEVNPLLDAIANISLSTVASDYDDYIVYNEDGREVTNVTDAIYEEFDIWDKLEEMSSETKEGKLPDMSMEAAARILGWNPSTPEEMIVEQYEIDFGTSVLPQMSSLKNYYNWVYSDDYIIDDVKAGYSSLIDDQLKQAISENDSTQRLYLNTVVDHIEQNDNNVTVYTKDGRTFTGKHAIVTFSLGVLQNSKVSFEPDLPDWKWRSVHSFKYGNYLHFYLQFPATFWDDQEWILYASETRGHYPLWQNFNKFWPGSNILQCTLTEPYSDRVALMSDDDIIAEAMEVLIRLYGPGIPSPTGIVVPRYKTDPLFMGTYSDWNTGFSDDSFEALRASVGRVHFAGEHTSYKYFGYMVGAQDEGKLIAEKITSCASSDDCPEYRALYLNRGCTYKSASNFDEEAIEEDGSCRYVSCPATSIASKIDINWVVFIYFAVVFHEYLYP